MNPKIPPKLKITRHAAGKSVRYSISGTIEGDAEFPQLDIKDPIQVIIDTKDLSYISSAGVRRWMVWTWGIAKLSPSTEIIVDNCPPSFIKHFGAINGFLPESARIRSTFVPYFCDACDDEYSEPIREDDERIIKLLRGDKSVRFEHRCPSCAKSHELETSPMQFFQFFARNSSKKSST